MKKSFLFISLLFALILANGQFKFIAESPGFQKPLFWKVLQLKNGGTVFCFTAKKEGLSITFYDADHKQKLTRRIETANKRLRDRGPLALFEISNDIVLILGDYDNGVFREYRLILDRNTGDIKDEKQIAELMKVTKSKEYAIAFGDVPSPDCFIKKDPGSDYYALAIFNSFEPDRNKRIEIVLYGPDHNEVSRAYYHSPQEKYKYLEYKDMTIVDGRKVSVLAFAYNTARSGGRESELLYAYLEKGAETITINELDFSGNLFIEKAVTEYNPATKKNILLVNASEKKNSNEYQVFLAYIDPFSGKTEKVISPYPSEASEKSIELFGKKSAYRGLPKDLFINNDGSFAVVSEEVTKTNTQNRGYIEAGNIAVSVFNKNGEEIKNYLIPRSHELGNSEEFKTFAYLNSTGKVYILLNDIERNEESITQRGKVTTIYGIEECDAFYFELGGPDVLPRRRFLFGRPESKNDHNLALFGTSDYSKNNNEYITLKQDGAKAKTISLVWLQPQ